MAEEKQEKIKKAAKTEKSKDVVEDDEKMEEKSEDVELEEKGSEEVIGDNEDDESSDLDDDSKSSKTSRYYEGVGRRKRAVARVRLFTKGEKDFVINDMPYAKYFPTESLQSVADASLRKMKVTDKFLVSVKVSGGGLNGQAEAVRHGISRALVKFNADFRKRLRRATYLSRDPREKERRKFGLKKARRAPQWSKR